MAYIYAIGESENGPVKIGFTTDTVLNRLRAIQTGHYRPLMILATVEIADDQASRVEFYLHALLADHAIRGEWFSIGITQDKLAKLTTKAQAIVARLPVQPIIPEEAPDVFPEPTTDPGQFLPDWITEPQLTYTWCDDEIEIELSVVGGCYTEALKKVRLWLEQTTCNNTAH